MKYDCIKSERAYYRCLDQIGHQTVDLYLCYCGIEYCPPDHFYGPKIRTEYLVHFLFRGRGYFKINGNTYELKAEQAFFVPPGIETCYYADPADPYAYVWVAFDGEKASSYLDQTALSVLHPVCDLRIPASQFRSLAEQIMAAKELKISNDIRRVGYLYHILAKLTASVQSKSSGSIPLNYPAETYAEYAIQYIELNYDHINVSDIVNYVGINRSYLYTIFKRQFNVSPQEYLIRYRMNQSASLLLTTTRTITSIAQSVGYEDALNFSKIFKKHFGTSPKHYRLIHQKPKEE